MKYEVTARITVDADSAVEAVELFDAEYRDPFNVVNLHAELIVADWATGARVTNIGTDQTSSAERRNGSTLVTHPTPRFTSQVVPSWCTRCGVGYEEGLPTCECAGDPPVDKESDEYRTWKTRADLLRYWAPKEPRHA